MQFTLYGMIGHLEMMRSFIGQMLGMSLVILRIILSNTDGSSSIPSIAESGNNVYVVWRDNTPGSYDILYRRSTDGGASFGSTVNLSNNDGHSDLPAIATSGSNVYVVWFDNTPGNFEIFLRKSVNTGDTFGSTVNYSHIVLETQLLQP